MLKTHLKLYISQPTCYPSKNINKIPGGIGLKLRRIGDSDEKYEKRSDVFHNYLITRKYSPPLVAKQFKTVSQISRDNARKPCT